MDINSTIQNAEQAVSNESIQIEQLSIEGEHRKLGAITDTTSDAVEKIVQIADYTDISSSLKCAPKDDTSIDIKLFLAKPEIVSSGNLQTTDGPSTFPKYNCTDPMVSSSLKYNKISSVLGLRFTTVVTLQVNANRFQAGRYILAFLNAGGAETTSRSSWALAHSFTKVQVTQLPHVELDLACDTQVQLRIPYVSHFPCWGVNSASVYLGDPGYFFLYPYSPLITVAGTSVAPYTLWVHYEDVQLFGNSLPQSGKLTKVSRNRDIIEQEIDVSKPISGGLRLISCGATMLTKVPLISSIAAPVAWATDLMSNTAHMFGYSKPHIEDGPTRMERQPHTYMANCDSHDGAFPLSLSLRNRVRPMPGFGGTDIDEMSIDFIKSIFSWFKTITWTTSNASGAILTSNYASPQVFGSTNTDSSNTLYSFPPITYLSYMFNYWSGGLILKLKFVKTEFHSGRLALILYPEESSETGGTIPDPTLAQSAYLYREIIDIRKGSEFTFELPYISIVNWRNTYGSNSGYAKWCITVIDALCAPATVSSSVPILLEVAGATDLKFAFPHTFSYCPVIPSAVQSGYFKFRKGNKDTEADPCNKTSSVVGGVLRCDSDASISELCIGEEIVSLRSLLKRGAFVPTDGADYSLLYILPAIGYWLQSGTGIVGTGGYSDPYNVFASIYALSRGSIRIRIMPLSLTTAQTLYIRLHGADFGSGGFANNIWSVGSADLAQLIYDASNENIMVAHTHLGGAVVQTGQYAHFHSRNNVSNMLIGTGTFSYSAYTDRNQIYVTNLDASPVPYLIHRSGGDDITFGGFVSIPPFALPARPS